MSKITDIPPHDQIAEESLIGCCIQSNEAFLKVQSRITLSDFYIEINRQAYSHICNMSQHNMPVNSESFIRYLNSKDIENINVAYLNRLISVSPIPSNAEFFADIVIAKAKARALITASENIRTIAMQTDTANIFKAIVESESIIGDISRGYNGGIDYYTEEKYKADRDHTLDGLPWGYPSLDQWCSIPVGRSAYIGSISNGGKSTFMFNVAHSLAMRGHKIGIFTYEDSRFDSTMRMNFIWYSHLVQVGGIDLFPKGMNFPQLSFWEYRKRVRGKVDRFDEVDNVCRAFSHEHTFFFDKNLKVEEIETYVKHILNEHEELNVIFLDYLQIIPTSDDDHGYMKLKNLVNGLNEIARRYNVSVISACQMTVSEHDSDKKDYMKISRVREAKDIFHSCALFLGLHNETQFKAQQKGDETVTDIDEGCFDIMKNKTQEGVEKKNIPFKLERNKLRFNIKYGGL